MLTVREERVRIQNALLAESRAPVIAFTMNIAGPVKVTALSHRAFLWGMEQLRLGFVQNRMPVHQKYSRSLPTGDEGYFAVDAPAERVKALCVEIEESTRMGRLFDMDVIGTDGYKLERGSERPCIVCGRPGRDCASRRLHTVEELQAHTASLLQAGLWFADQRLIAALATQALLGEVTVTPKPGLVDRANSGAHRDMDLFTFQASAAALSSYWGDCAGMGHFDRCVLPASQNQPVPPPETFAKLRPIGKQAERDMLSATGSVNTHKGAIFTLGVLCGAAGRLWTAENGFPVAEAILDEAAAMTRATLEAELPAARWNTAGEQLFRQHGTRGIRGEVADGLPAVREIALPTFRELLGHGLDRNHAAAVTLLHLIVNVEDTNLLHRGGSEGAAWARKATAALLACSGEQTDEPADKQCLSLQFRIPTLDEIAALDRQFIERNLSPGGCADLLAVTLFLDALGSAAAHADGANERMLHNA